MFIKVLPSPFIANWIKTNLDRWMDGLVEKWDRDGFA